ncbi:hypothetical protein EYF80_012448 [Liparis tanakae]|uniref:Uncharacterized protein n=1 Tax=Liparis tanakae TaxID=230148 RepID=A0A4Z2IIS1_9TELE|nr:hypothetical protein EYF80_012448 [Liparis tanakae]
MTCRAPAYLPRVLLERRLRWLVEVLCGSSVFCWWLLSMGLVAMMLSLYLFIRASLVLSLTADERDYALEGVQGSGDLAGELLAPIHTLPLQVMAQVRYVILVPEGMRIHPPPPNPINQPKSYLYPSKIGVSRMLRVPLELGPWPLEFLKLSRAWPPISTEGM